MATEALQTIINALQAIRTLTDERNDIELKRLKFELLKYSKSKEAKFTYEELLRKFEISS